MFGVSLYMAAAAVVFCWATWSVLSPVVHDGIVGRLLYGASALSAFAVLAAAAPYNAQLALNLCMAGLAIRSFLLRKFWWRFRQRLKSDTCPNRRESDGF